MFKKFLKYFLCDMLGWHKNAYYGEYFYVNNDKKNNRISTCSRCNKKIMEDSQGNWFTF